jgi:predicted nucleic acid-binding protein
MTSLQEWLANIAGSDVCIAVITKAELRYGIARSRNKRVNRSVVEEFLTFVRVLPWDDDAAEHYAEQLAPLTGPRSAASDAHCPYAE